MRNRLDEPSRTLDRNGRTRMVHTTRSWHCYVGLKRKEKSKQRRENPTVALPCVWHHWPLKFIQLLILILHKPLCLLLVLFEMMKKSSFFFFSFLELVNSRSWVDAQEEPPGGRPSFFLISIFELQPLLLLQTSFQFDEKDLITAANRKIDK